VARRHVVAVFQANSPICNLSFPGVYGSID
jgi:hypothetical protein